MGGTDCRQRQDRLKETCEYHMIFDFQGAYQRVAYQMSDALVCGWPALSRSGKIWHTLRQMPYHASSPVLAAQDGEWRRVGSGVASGGTVAQERTRFL